MSSSTIASAFVKLWLIVLLGSSALSAQQNTLGEGWPTYGGDPGGMRYSSATEINRTNLSQLQPVWTYHTHALDVPRSGSVDASFEATPVLFKSSLFLTTPFDVVIAVDAATGKEQWTYDPQVGHLRYGNIVTSRGVAIWSATDPIRPNLPACRDRIFVGTIDARLIAVDAANGHLCTDFGHAGQIDLKQDVYFSDTYGVTSPPTVVGNTVIVGSLIGDNHQVDAESGVVRAYDAISGKLLWNWEPLPWAHGQKVRTGAANTWSVISADPALGLVYLPTGSAAPDYYGGMRPGDDRDADSIVALDVHTGKKVWSYQVVHHDLWDYDIASQPLLFTFRNRIPAVAITTKMGLIFVLNRRTGEPLYPIHERPVPQTDVPGEVTSPTQPFQDLPPLSSLSIDAPDPSQSWQRSPANQAVCQAQLASLRNEGIYTPPSIRGSVMFPGNLGGVNWGSAALDPTTGILYANTNRIAFQARLIPRWSRKEIRKLLRGNFFDWANWGICAGIILAGGTLLRRLRRHTWVPGRVTLAVTTALMLATIPIALHREPPEPENISHFGHDLGPQNKAPYLIQRDLIVDHDGHSCTAPPWGVISAVNLNTGAKVWATPLGSAIPGQHTGITNFGGPIVTATGLVFTAAAEDPYIRAFDASTGTELWKHDLPVPAQSTPMTYTLNGRQYIVIAAGGHGDKATKLGDSLIAFSLSPSTTP